MKPQCNHSGDQVGKNFTLKNIPDGLYDKVRERAERNHRSINGEIISILDEATGLRLVNRDGILARARELRARTKGFKLDQAFIDLAKREGRP